MLARKEPAGCLNESATELTGPLAGGSERMQPEMEHVLEIKQRWRRQRPAPNYTEKTVTMATTSRHHTHTDYVMRKPLFTAQQHASILKKHRETDERLEVIGGEEKLLVRARQELTPESSSMSFMDMSSSTATGGEPHPALHLSELCPDGSAVSNLSCSIHRAALPLTSTVASRSGQTELRLGERDRRVGKKSKASSSGCLSMSRYHANYTACAIPKALPPPPDKDPNKAYLALLDYTYPLKPGQVDSHGVSSEPLQANLLLHDSGIELDHAWSSSSLSVLGCTAALSVGHRSPDVQGFSSCSDGLLTMTDHEGLSLASVDIWKNTDGMSCGQGCGPHAQLSGLSLCVSEEEVDQDFRPLPERLGQLQLLCSQVRKVTDSLQPSSIVPADRAETGPERSTAHKAVPCSEACLREPEALRRSCGLQGGLRLEVEPLCGSQGGRVQRDSLMQHIQVFCSHLQQLIQQLYVLSEQTELMAEPTVNSSLADYQSFESAMSSHRPLASSVVTSGRCLLSCINSTSSFLRDSLVLIESQSGSLERHTEHFLSCILSAMATLVQLNQEQSTA